MQLLHTLKKITVLTIAVLAVIIVGAPNLRADTSSSSNAILQQIANNTNGILTELQNVPQFFTAENFGKVIKMAASWLTFDQTPETASMQTSFGNVGTILGTDNTTDVIPASQTAMLSLFGQDMPSITKSFQNFTNVIPNLNDITYTSYLGYPVAPKAPNSNIAYLNYILNASGANFGHMPPPSTSLVKGSNDFLRYQNYYNLVTAVRSFNVHVLTELYYRTGATFTTAQNALINQAGDSTWILKIASQDLGIVFRQLLMFTSQNYVLTSELVKLQKESLMAQVMTNALLSTNNLQIEPYLYSKAAGVPYKP